jgi:hypothetical protein
MRALQNLEHRRTGERDVYVRLIHAGTDSAAFEGARTLVRITACDLAMARVQMTQLPTTFPLGLFGQPLALAAEAS